MRAKWVLIGASVILLAIAAGAISVWRQDRAQNQTQAQPPAPSQPSGEIILPGKLEAQQITYVEAVVNGKVDQLLVEVGEDVYEGQLLARISNIGLETSREVAQAAADNAQERVNKLEAAIIAARLEASRARADATRARSEFERTDKLYRRQKLLYGEGATPRLVYERSEKEFQIAQTEFESLDQLAKQAEGRVSQLIKDLEAAKKAFEEKSNELDHVGADLKAAEVHAPVTGTIVSRSADPGGEVEPGTASARLYGIAADISALEAVIEPEPPVLARLKPEMPALVILADVPEPVEGKVKSVNEGQAVVEFTSPTPLVRPGMTAQIRLKLD
jgi:HlyD family secretion protein